MPIVTDWEVDVLSSLQRPGAPRANRDAAGPIAEGSEPVPLRTARAPRRHDDSAPDLAITGGPAPTNPLAGAPVAAIFSWRQAMSVPTGARSHEKSISEGCCGVCGGEEFSVVVVCERPGEFSDRMVCKRCGAHHVSGA